MLSSCALLPWHCAGCELRRTHKHRVFDLSISHVPMTKSSDSRSARPPSIGIGGVSRLRPSHTTVHTEPYTAVRRVKHAERKAEEGRGHRSRRYESRSSEFSNHLAAKDRETTKYTRLTRV
jgi:hypothetical protein